MHTKKLKKNAMNHELASPNLNLNCLIFLEFHQLLVVDDSRVDISKDVTCCA